ncbi:MAG: hypothetical protein D6828_03460, partial [Nitrospirae bacterium]
MIKGIGDYILPITDNKEQRRRIVDFLSNFEGEKKDETFWRERLSFWWDKNPFYSEDLPKGWIVVLNGIIVGFFGVIVTNYTFNGKTYKALNSTTWRVLRA